jgi:hypothetical protein
MESDKKDETAPKVAEQPAPEGLMIAEEKKKGPNWVIIGLLILLLLLGLVLGWMWWKDKDKTTPAAEDDKKSSVLKPSGDKDACADGFTRHEDEALDTRFCYPESWGEVSKQDAKFEEADTGSRWRLSFSDKEQVNLGLVSQDWGTAVGRDGVCVDPATQVLPDFAPFSTDWVTPLIEPVNSGLRGIEVQADEYLIQESVDNLLTNGVCITGYKVVSNSFEHAAASYSAEFNATITDPAQHMAAPNTLVPAGDRADFAVFVKSITAIN